MLFVVFHVYLWICPRKFCHTRNSCPECLKCHKEGWGCVAGVKRPYRSFPQGTPTSEPRKSAPRAREECEE